MHLVETERIQYDEKDTGVNESIIDVAQSDQIEIVATDEKNFKNMIGAAYQRLSPFKKALIELGVGKWYIGSFKKSEWNGRLPFYAWKCKTCGKIIFSHPRGHKKYLQCQNCIQVIDYRNTLASPQYFHK